MFVLVVGLYTDGSGCLFNLNFKQRFHVNKCWGSAKTPSLHTDGKWWKEEITDATAPRQPVVEPGLDLDLERD